MFLLAGFFAVAIESTSIEWAAFRFTDDFGTTAGFAALAYVAVTGGMTVGRLAGDWVSVRLGGPRLTVVSVVVAGAGLGMASFSGVRGLGLAGYAIAGLGIATMLPTLYDTAAKHPGRPGVGLGALTAGLRIAGLVIPLIVGTLAATGLSVGAAIAVVTLPSLLGYLAVMTALSDGSSRSTVPLLGAVADRFDVVAVGVANEPAVVVRVVLGPHAWLVEHLGSGLDGGREEGIDGGPVGCGERVCGIRGSPHPRSAGPARSRASEGRRTRARRRSP